MSSHPSFCATRSPVPCGHHLAEPAVIAATGGEHVQQLEVAAARTRCGGRAVAVTAIDQSTGRSVTVLLRHRQVTAAVTALLVHDELAGST